MMKIKKKKNNHTAGNLILQINFYFQKLNLLLRMYIVSILTVPKKTSTMFKSWFLFNTVQFEFRSECIYPNILWDEQKEIMALLFSF